MLLTLCYLRISSIKVLPSVSLLSVALSKIMFPCAIESCSSGLLAHAPPPPPTQTHFLYSALPSTMLLYQLLTLASCTSAVSWQVFLPRSAIPVERVDSNANYISFISEVTRACCNVMISWTFHNIKACH
jgi:hypothetical protein